MQVSINGTPLVVHLADDDVSRSQGLMGYDGLEENTGMLFRWPTVGERSFWMKDTSIPLDIAYISDEGKIIEIKPLEPYSLQSVVSSKPASCALEVNRGWFDNNGIQPGDVVHGVFNEMPRLVESVLRHSPEYRLADQDFYYQEVVDAVIEDVMSSLPKSVKKKKSLSFEYAWPYPVDVDAWAENWDDVPPEFDVELEVRPQEFEEGHPGWNIDGSAGEGSYVPGNVELVMSISPELVLDVSMLVQLEAELANVIAHELHHLTQAEGPLQRPSCPVLPPREGDSYHEYFTSACEVPAFLIGFRAESSRTGKPVEELVRRYLQNQVTANVISSNEADDIAQRWLSHTLWNRD